MAQASYRDESIRYQQERMVFLQWDKKKFTPKPGFLSLNPNYWLTWGLFHPNYYKKDLRPLSASGPQTQRLALAGTLNAIDDSYKLQSDTTRNTALSEVANYSGLVTELDPLWRLYYSRELRPVLNTDHAAVLTGLSPQVKAKLVTEGLFDWYTEELDMLRQRVEAAHSADMDRGARIMAYHRLLMEYRKLAGVWAIRVATAAKTIRMSAQQQQVRTGQVSVSNWTPQTDVQIANEVLKHVQ
ncbi:hypothetical protein GCM10023149_50580 [Mucilaginibacter gynuensis]|uniref:Outer membrane efflux protein n=2 Tax=Mucilaginibacter gynuensis TaxID=1302236 RepID=A0ABP8HI82_9SPHI